MLDLIKRVTPATAPYNWILAITFIAYFFSSFGNGANDVANAYATSVAARTLTMLQVGFLSICTEFFGAVVLGERVTGTIKNGIIDINRFTGRPAVLMLAMGCAEVASATWLMTATALGMPVSTTQTIVGALIGVGFATQANIKWEWSSGSVSQVAASWGIAPAVAGGFSALIFATVKYSVLERKDSFKWAMRLIPVYFAFTAAILALFITIETPGSDLDELGAGPAAGIILGVFFAILIVAYVFFMPFFERKLIKKDPRVRLWHVPMGPLLRKDNVKLYWPGKGEEYVTNYYEDAYGNVTAGTKTRANADMAKHEAADIEASKLDADSQETKVEVAPTKPRYISPYKRWIVPVRELSWANPKKWWNWFKFLLLRGVFIDAITHDSARLREIHARAHRYDVRVEHLWTYCQVISAMLMSIAHGSNDIANAVGPVAAVYETYLQGEVATRSPTPVWLLAIGGILVGNGLLYPSRDFCLRHQHTLVLKPCSLDNLNQSTFSQAITQRSPFPLTLLGLGFWFMGYHIIRALGNKITQMSPTRGFAIELGAAIAVLLASRLALPVSTTQCLTGAAIGVAMMKYDLRAVNWRQVAFIFFGWVVTLPAAGLLGGLLCVMALNAPSF